MYVLSVDCKDLRSFASPEDIEDGFAALSHVWDGTNEQSFQDIRRIQERCRSNGTDPRRFVSAKIRGCCELAERQGYRWVWIDTCCIDKTSSAELSEAINSMFRYYSLASVCYGYLRDVPLVSVASHRSLGTLVSRSVWFQRGWTLQELVAPRFFVFLSKSWQVLGTKSDFAEILEESTGIPAAVLRLEVSHTAFSIAERMSWFGTRQTKRPEDEAYCLLGIFEIHMPPLYGEGRSAFRRLQEELMKQSADTTLFAWEGRDCDEQERSCLLAPSPAAFRGSTTTYAPSQYTEWHDPTPCTDPVLNVLGGDVKDMAFSVTAYGILAYIPVIVCSDEIYGDLSWSESRHGREHLLLRLKKDPGLDGPGGHAHPSRRPLYSVCRPPSLGPSDPSIPSSSWTTCSINEHGEYTLPCAATALESSWQTVLIRHRPSLHRLPGQVPESRTPFIQADPRQLTLDAPFRFGTTHIRKFMRESQAERVVVVHHRDVESELPSGLMAASDSDSDSDAFRTTYRFVRNTDWGLPTREPAAINIAVGLCSSGEAGFPKSQGAERPAPAVWATVHAIMNTSESAALSEEALTGKRSGISIPEHDCLEDHVARWPYRKTFPLCTRMVVTLSFAPCRLNNGRTLLLEASLDSKHLEARIEHHAVRDTIHSIRRAFSKIHEDLQRFDREMFRGRSGAILRLSHILGLDQLRMRFHAVLDSSRADALSGAAYMRRAASMQQCRDTYTVDDEKRAELKERMARATKVFSKIADDVYACAARVDVVLDEADAHITEEVHATQVRILDSHVLAQDLGLGWSAPRFILSLLHRMDVKRKRTELRKTMAKLLDHQDSLHRHKILLESTQSELQELSVKIRTLVDSLSLIEEHVHLFIERMDGVGVKCMDRQLLLETERLCQSIAIFFEEYAKGADD